MNLIVKSEKTKEIKEQTTFSIVKDSKIQKQTITYDAQTQSRLK